MAFHVACPITCERICYCGLGSLGGRVEPWEEIERVERFLEDPWWVREGEGGVVRVLVPRVAPVGESLGGGGGGEDADVEAEEGGGGVVVGPASAQAKRAALQRRAAAASLAAEDYVRKLEMGAVADELGEAATDQISSAVKVICRICFSGETEGSERARKMLSCKICNKKYHRSCLKSWAEYRDLFHWSSWACPSCRVCEICRRAGDPNKFMFCKRCDAAYHCYCQQPSHKNVSHGPYLCPKHTRCHSCGSTVHGSGHSTRWFLGYNFCDACGRLFMKEKYCPVCLKVYRDSESTPMVCCDVCQRWVHCQCDGISDEKYLQFQADRNLYYKCAACRGDCYQVTDVDDAVQELWRRRDKADQDMIAKLRAAAGLPSEEEYFAISPYSDDDDGGPVILKSDYGRSLKFSVKGLSDNATKNITEEGKKVLKSSSTNKKPVKKKGYQMQLSGEPFEKLERSEEARSLESSFVDEKVNETVHRKTVGPGTKIKFSVDHLGSVHHSQNHETMVNNVNEVNNIHAKETFHGSYFKEGIKKNEPKNESVKGTKLVIHLGGRNRKLNSSPMSDASSCQRDQEKASSNGSEGSSQHQVDDKRHVFEPHAGNIRIDAGRGADLDDAGQFTVSKRLGDVMRLTSDVRPNSSASNNLEDHQPSSTSKTLIFHRRKTEGRVVGESPGEVDLATRRNDEIPQKKQSKDTLTVSQCENSDVAQGPSFLNSLSKDSRPLLKLKFKNPYLDSHGSSAPKEVERNVVKGQRSKRKRPSLMEKDDIKMGVNHVNLPHEANMDEAMDANWILRRLGKNAIGKRVEVHQPSDNSWHKGVVSDALEGSASLSVKLDDGRSKTLELGKQGVRFIPQKQRRTKL